MFKRIAILSLAAAAVYGSSASELAAQRRAGRAASKPAAFACMKTFTAADWGIMLRQTKTANPQVMEKLLADRELREKQAQNLGELLSMSCQAVRDGLAEAEPNRSELEYIAMEIAAVEYDRLKDTTGTRAPLDSVTPEQVTAFYKVAGNEAKAARFIEAKIAVLLRSSPTAAEGITDEVKAEARTHYAKMAILAAESRLKAKALDPGFPARTTLTAKLQQAQFLARLVSEEQQFEVSDEEVAAYAASHPEFDSSAKRAKAEAILKRAAAGEDFAELANEFSEDPGNISDTGESLGGVYRTVKKGVMVAPFEAAALALKPGEVSPSVVESDFGFHVIKLEKIDGAGDDFNYDVRHVLISTMVKDPSNEDAGEVPIKEYVRRTVEAEKEAEWIRRTVAANPIAMAAIPTVIPAEPKRTGKTLGRKRSR